MRGIRDDRKIYLICQLLQLQLLFLINNLNKSRSVCNEMLPSECEFNWKFNCFCGCTRVRPFTCTGCQLGWVHSLIFFPPFHSGLSSSLNLDVSYIEICHCSLGTFGCSGWLCCFNYLRLYLFKYLPIQLGCTHTHTHTRFIFFQCTDHTLVCRVIYYLIDGAIADVILLNDEHN